MQNAAMTDTHYREPGWFTKHIFNNIVKGLTRLGLSVWGSRIIEVRGRTSGEPGAPPSTCSPSTGPSTSSHREVRRNGCATSGPPMAKSTC